MRSPYKVYGYDQPHRPVVTAGSRAVLIGARSGLFPDLGFQVEGEMGGLWADEKKVCDGFFLTVDHAPLLCADVCEADPCTTAFHYRLQEQALHVVRRQCIPDGVRGCVIELTVENLRPLARTVEVSFTVRTDILTVAGAQGEDGMELGRDVGEYDEQTQAFYARDSRNPWHAVWGADGGSRVLQADLPQTVEGFGNTRGKGVNGRLFYRLRVGAGGQAAMRLFVAGGFASRSRAEDALATLRGQADALTAAKAARLRALAERSDATLPEPALERAWNWTKIYGDWLTRELPRGGVGLCADLPEHPSLFGEGFAQAMGALLPLGGGEKVAAMLRTLVRLAEEAQLAPGRLPKRVSRSGRIRQTGGVKESALFVALVYRVLRWTGDRRFAGEMLPMTGLCVSYLRRATRGFEDVREDIVQETRLALEAQAGILRLTGADDGACRDALEKMGKPDARGPVEGAPQAAWARWHGEHAQVEQMIACLKRMAEDGAPGLPGAMKAEEAGALLSARSAAGFVGPMTDGLFGLAPDAAEKTLRFAPHTPIGWDGWKLERVRMGGADVTIQSRRVSPGRAAYTIDVSEPGWQVRVTEDGVEKAYPVEGTLALTLGD